MVAVHESQPLQQPPTPAKRAVRQPTPLALGGGEGVRVEEAVAVGGAEAGGVAVGEGGGEQLGAAARPGGRAEEGRVSRAGGRAARG